MEGDAFLGLRCTWMTRAQVPRMWRLTGRSWVKHRNSQAAWPSPQLDIDIFYVNMFCYDTYMRLSD